MKKYSAMLSVLAAILAVGLLADGGRAGGSPEVPAHLAARVDQACRQAAERGRMEHAGAITRDRLLQLANAPCRRVRTCAIYALGELAEGRAVEMLRGKLTSSDVRVRRVAAAALGKIGDPDAVPELITAANDRNEDLGVRCAAARSLGRFADLRAAEALKRLAHLSRGPVRTQAEGALRRMEGRLLWSAR
jgi:HEAT repeat protein